MELAHIAFATSNLGLQSRPEIQITLGDLTKPKARLALRKGGVVEDHNRGDQEIGKAVRVMTVLMTPINREGTGIRAETPNIVPLTLKIKLGRGIYA